MKRRKLILLKKEKNKLRFNIITLIMDKEWWCNNIIKYPCEYKQQLTDEYYYLENESKPKPGTRLYDADCLFKRLVDYCYNNNIVNNDGTLLFNPNVKPSFFIFIKNVS